MWWWHATAYARYHVSAFDRRCVAGDAAVELCSRVALVGQRYTAVQRTGVRHVCMAVRCVAGVQCGMRWWWCGVTHGRVLGCDGFVGFGFVDGVCGSARLTRHHSVVWRGGVSRVPVRVRQLVAVLGAVWRWHGDTYRCLPRRYEWRVVRHGAVYGCAGLGRHRFVLPAGGLPYRDIRVAMECVGCMSRHVRWWRAVASGVVCRVDASL